MSADMVLMKNLIDMGIIESNSDNTISTSFRTPDNNYIINLKRKPRLSFLSENSDSNYNCSIEFTSSIGYPILDIQSTEIEMSKIIDLFYNFIETNIGYEVYFYFNPITTNCIPKIIQLSIRENDYTLGRFGYYDEVNKNEYNLSIYDKLDDQLILRLNTILRYDNMINLLEKIYYVFLIDVNVVDRNYII